ncbi:MAG TPA: leucine-rich repeat domain-containing protein [Hyphomonadaceae bacterium]|nr:leucine-rich repeat domain-containing protein [Hyphomonadaceae bacterium]
MAEPIQAGLAARREAMGMGCARRVAENRFLAVVCGLFLVLLPGLASGQFQLATNNGTITIVRYIGAGGAVSIPASTNGMPVTAIADQAFRDIKTITSVTIPDSVLSIGKFVWQYCSVTSVQIPNSTTNLGINAFSQCVSLTDVTLGTNLSNIGYGCFYMCSNLGSIVIPDSVLDIGDNAFMYCPRLTNVTMSAQVRRIGPSAFRSTAIGNMVLPDSLTDLGDYAFCACGSLTNVNLPAGLQSLGIWALGGTAIRSATIPAGILNLPNSLFDHCSALTNVTIAGPIASIGNQSFAHCPGLTRLTFPASLTSISSYAFYDCGGLSEIFFAGDAPSVGTTIFLGDGNVRIYHLPNTTGWSDAFAGKTTILWNPLLRCEGDPATASFGIAVTGTTNIPVVLEASSNLAGIWTTLDSCLLTNGTLRFADPFSTNYPSRFYRIRSPN